MIDVANGVSQAQVNGTSLHNYANATVLANLVDQALSKGVEASKITVCAISRDIATKLLPVYSIIMDGRLESGTRKVRHGQDFITNFAH